MIDLQSFGHKSSFHHNPNHASNQKALFNKVLLIGSVIEGMQWEVDDMQSFGHKH